MAIELSQSQWNTIKDIHDHWVYEPVFTKIKNKKTGKLESKRTGQRKRDATEYEKQLHLAKLYANNHINAFGPALILEDVIGLYLGTVEPDVHPNKEYEKGD